MTTYHNLKDKPERFHALTGYTLESLLNYSLIFWICGQTMSKLILLWENPAKNGGGHTIKIAVSLPLKICYSLF